MEDDINRELAAVLDVLLLELLGCWCKYEEHVISLQEQGTKAAAAALPEDSQRSLLQSGAVASQLLGASMPLVMRVFTLGDFEASATIVPSLNKFVALLKSQQTKNDIVRKNADAEKGYFVAARYLTQLLTAVCMQMQYPQDFQFDGDSEDEVAEMEVSLCQLVAGGL